jgi:anti-sigma B factor antagonist
MSDPSPQPFGFEVEIQGSRAIVRLAGDLDMAAAATCRDVLHSVRHGDTTDVVVDLRGLTFLDSMGLSALLETHNVGLDGPHAVSFIRGTGSVHRVFQITQMEERLDWIDPDGMAEGSA